MKINVRIKELRKEKGYTLEKLAGLTGFTKGYLSKIERSTKTPPFATVQTIADALQIDITVLLDKNSGNAGSKNIDILMGSADGLEEMEEISPVYSFIPLVNNYKNKYMTPFLFEVKKGMTDVATHDSEEFVYVLEGELELNYEGHTYKLCKGDSFYLDARIKHNFVNKHEKTASLIAVHFNYRRF